MTDLDSIIASRPGISLAVLDAIADLQTRRDRKYVLTEDEAIVALVSVQDRLAALEINGIRSFQYRSLYFDTPDLSSYLGAATSRRRRYKVRVRQYVDHGNSMLEVKTRGVRETTVKHRVAYDTANPEQLTSEAMGFIDHMVGRPALGASLVASMWTGYQRSTLVDTDDNSRITIDRRVQAAPVDGAWRQITDRVIVETKAAGDATPLDYVLWSHGIRPVRVSKFAAAMALHNPSLPANKWRRVLRRHFVRPFTNTF
ncbi:MAG: VTC domain-containing protein [Actinobacteria bacterium]|nr:VTC domain-containing protein [Actinomycetota bacterium]